jgi:hypothetical protein
MGVYTSWLYGLKVVVLHNPCRLVLDGTFKQAVITSISFAVHHVSLSFDFT